jgi:hypothetical protein
MVNMNIFFIHIYDITMILKNHTNNISYVLGLEVLTNGWISSIFATWTKLK